MENPQRVNVAGTRVSATSYEELVKLCAEWTLFEKGGRSRYICVTSVHGVIEARRDQSLRTALEDADVVTPDGMPVVWALRSFGKRHQERVYGPTLMLHLCEAAARAGQKLFLYGARPDTLQQLEERLCSKYVGLTIAGSYAPPFRNLTPQEEADIERQVVASGADLLFVGLSTPKQEKWMHSHRDSLGGVTMIGVGAAFDFHAGRTRQAPLWMQRNGLEWFFRLCVEPGRLWRRYLLTTPRFIPLWLKQWLFDRP